jgi:ribonuclease HII
VAAACVLPEGFPTEILKDSKKLSPRRRLKIKGIIRGCARWGIGLADEKEIDGINILRASLLAMERAWVALHRSFAGSGVCPEVLVDGPYCPPGIDAPCTACVHGDAIHPPIMAASILAKCERDRIMCGYDRLYPQYQYAIHKGYPTARHRELCRTLGPSPIQRLSFTVR